MRLLLVAALVLLAWPAWATNYYVDYGASGANNGTSTGDAWTSLIAAMEAAHDAGDTIFVRATHTETLGSDIDPVSDGTSTAPIVVWGYIAGDSAGDIAAWSGDSGTPTITVAGYKLNFSVDDDWILHRLHFTGTTNKCIYIVTCSGILIRHCTFTNFDSSADYGIETGSKAYVRVEDCVFDGGDVDNDDTNSGRGIYHGSTRMHIVRCTFDDLVYGIRIKSGADVYARRCRFGQDDYANTNDVVADAGLMGHAFLIDCDMDDNSKLVTSTSWGETIARQYIDAKKRPMIYYETGHFTWISDYTVARSGGAEYSLKIDPTSEVGLRSPIEYAFAVHADSAETRDYTIYAYRDANWDPKPEAEELYLEVTYSSGDTLATAQSTATLSSASTWTALTVSSITPNHDGPVLCTVWLKDYDADGYIYIDPRLVATGESYHETINWGMSDLSALPPAATGGFPQIIQYLPDTDSQWRMACFAR